MSSDERKKKLVGPWRSLHAVIWLIGIYILATRGLWWPGILVLVAISALYEAFLQRFVPEAYIEEKPAPSTSIGQAMETPPEPPVTATVSTLPNLEHRIELLPQHCPACNGPIRGHEVKWTGPQSANCPYCGTNLPMNKA